jgi:hypothetical protein
MRSYTGQIVCIYTYVMWVIVDHRVMTVQVVITGRGIGKVTKDAMMCGLLEGHWTLDTGTAEI